MGANGPSEDGHGEQVDSNAPEQVEHRELLSILEQLDQDVGTTHNDITELAGGAMQADTVPSFEQ
ncbi:MAG: hypothetical protein QF400_03120, partial [Candidatus Peribacteraceae bacterium]|nr:hypothetical protein [Candidatus Peribacteraceae bacterium]